MALRRALRKGGDGPPRDLPRQRRGTTPQMVGRYPEYDVLDNARHWDEVTRAKVLDRVERVPPLRFFDPAEAAALGAFCDVVTAQDREPRIPVLNFVDEKLWQGEGDGFQYFDMPEDSDTWRRVARGLDEVAAAHGFEAFAMAPDELRRDIVGRFAEGKLFGGAWATLNVKRAWTVVMRSVVQAFYAHPWAWSEIGFGGPAYPRGYSRFGSPHLQAAEREPWEGREEYSKDPIDQRLEEPPS